MVRVEFKSELNMEKFVEASRSFMREVVKVKKYKIVYIIGSDTRVAYAEGNSVKEVMLKFLTDNPAVSDVKRVEEVKE